MYEAGEKMVVYADILILTNFVVDYFLISLSCRFLHKNPRLWRLLLSAFVGGVLSLYIFLPQSNFFLQIIIHISMCAVLCFIAVGFGDLKTFLRSIAVLFCVNFAYSGAMIAVWMLFKPHGMVINNSVVYFDISPMFLILFSVVGYFGVLLARRMLKRKFSPNTYCDATLCCMDKTITLCGIVDTGNSLSDVFGISQIFITEYEIISSLLDEEKSNPARFRKIPCRTVSGERLLDGYRIDSAVILYNNKRYEFKNPILAVSAVPLDDTKIIINPENLD